MMMTDRAYCLTRTSQQELCDATGSDSLHQIVQCVVIVVGIIQRSVPDAKTLDHLSLRLQKLPREADSRRTGRIGGQRADHDAGQTDRRCCTPR